MPELYNNYLELLSKMHEFEKETDKDLPEYTKLWVEKVNRGGLFLVVNDKAFLLFRAMETAIRPTFSTVTLSITSTVQLMEQAKLVVLKYPCSTSTLALYTTHVCVCEPMESSESDNLL